VTIVTVFSSERTDGRAYTLVLSIKSGSGGGMVVEVIGQHSLNKEEEDRSAIFKFEKISFDEKKRIARFFMRNRPLNFHGKKSTKKNINHEWILCSVL